MSKRSERVAPEVGSLRDLLDRTERAGEELLAMARSVPEDRARMTRLLAKAEGVALVRSYIDEAICWQEAPR